MLTNKLDALKARIAKARDERGATDPILVIAAIAVSLILLVGGSFAVSSMITNGKNLNAKSDLDKVATAEVAYSANNDSFAAYNSGVHGTADKTLEKADVGFTPTAGADLQVVLVGDGWVAQSVSEATGGPTFYRSSESAATYNSIADMATAKDLPQDVTTHAQVDPSAVTFATN